MNDYEIHERTISLIGEEAFEKLTNAKVVLIGLGGVGSYILEALARAGIGHLVVADFEKIELSNINRQLFALHSTLGHKKTDCAYNRVRDINPDIDIKCYDIFVNKDNISDIIKDDTDYIIDAIDSVQSKIDIIKYAKQKGIEIISCMGTGNKTDNTGFIITSIKKTDTCPLAKKIRKILSSEGITDVDVLYSSCSNVKKISGAIPSISYVPSTAGLLIAGYVIQKLIEE